ncbi:PREDICTED: lysozyme g-like [Mesitornis unicolor]|uniref:lysozyme g-like n=1 Tax=Mesitornis unicolor TaxID=54374 RepID=UPI000528D08B|nr:PREDICTED: lysozyme g-like [Mesitornis unicolor]
MISALLLLGLLALVAPSMSYSCYGDISVLQAPTISCTPVRAPDCGLATIRRTAEADIVRLRKYEIPIKRVARNLCLDPALIAAIISQESRVGLLLNDGWDQGRQKYGLMQLGRQLYQPVGVWDSEDHINQGSTRLVLAINEVRARHPTWTWDQQLRGGICTYRARMGNLQVYEDDPCDRDDYYVNSVIRRAQYFKRNGF